MPTSKEPETLYRGSRTMRGEIEVDISLQNLRVRKHCYQEDEELLRFEEIQTEKGIGLILKKEIVERCPADRRGCEIHQDQEKLGLDLKLLPCHGAPVPGEVIQHKGFGKKITEEVVDEIDLTRDLEEILSGYEIYPQYEEENAEEEYYDE